MPNYTARQMLAQLPLAYVRRAALFCRAYGGPMGEIDTEGFYIDEAAIERRFKKLWLIRRLNTKPPLSFISSSTSGPTSGST
jgi:hypothetical protein